VQPTIIGVGRMVAAAGCLTIGALLAGCGSTPSPSAQPTVTVTETATASPGSSASSTTSAPPCTTAELTVSLGRGGAAAGSSYYPIEFGSTSASDCTLYGYPGVSFVTAAGAQVGAAATEEPVYPRELVTIAPGGTAHATLRVATAQNYPASTCHPVAVHRLKIYPPGQTTALYISLPATACMNAKVFVLGIYVVQPGASNQ